MKEIVLYISEKGRDSWSGKLPEPNRDGTDGPLATIPAAQKLLRKRKSAPARILIRGGLYRLSRPVVFRPEDSGSADAPRTYASYPGETAVFRGSRRIRGWKETVSGGKRVWFASARGISPDARELFVNGARRFRPKLPVEGFYEIEDPGFGTEAGSPVSTPQDCFKFSGRDIKKWRNISDVEVVILHYWAESRLRIRSVSTKDRIVRFRDKSRRRFKERSRPTRYYVENVAEAIAPGRWYLDRNARKLYYMPLGEEKLDDTLIEVPAAGQLVLFQGEPSAGRFLGHIHLQNLTFNHAAAHFDEISCSRQAASEASGAIRLEGSVNCSVANCEISHIGAYGLELAEGCSGNHITGNHIFQTGAGGIKINGSSAPADRSALTKNNTVSDNHIHDGGIISHCAVGILVMHSGGNTIGNNRIHHFYYTGISLGWVWGYFRHNVSTGNLVEYNHIHDIGRGWLSDMGGIYTLGFSRDTVLRGNLIHDVNCYEYGGWGIYFDEGTSCILAEDNIIYNCTGGFNQHYGRDNVLRNNIIGPCKQHHIRRLRAEDHLSFLFERNIVYMGRGKLLDGDFTGAGYIFNRNIYWRPGGRKISFLNRTFAEWRQTGQDADSETRDPKLAAPERGDFILAPDSPAFRLGFRPLRPLPREKPTRPETGSRKGPRHSPNCSGCESARG